MFFEKLSIKEKNIVIMVGSGIFFIGNIALYIDLYLRRQHLFSEYGSADVIEILDKMPLFGPKPYELSIECIFRMKCSLILAIISLLIFSFSLMELSKSRKKKK